MTNDIQNTLNERGKRYGDFYGHAYFSQKLKRVMQKHENYNVLPAHHKEALEMIQHKIARILNGDPNYADNWHDIAGYATLVENILSGDNPSPVEAVTK
jgi:hypothetical protein